MNKIALGLTVAVAVVIVVFVAVLILNLWSKSVKYKSFYLWGWCPSGTSAKFDQERNVFMPDEFIKANQRCCAGGYYGTMTRRGKNICCLNGFNCLDD